MEYRIKLNVLAQQELEQALLYFFTFRKTNPANFMADLENALAQLARNPFKALRYKSVRVIRLQEFPFALYFTVHEYEKQVTIQSCFQDFRNPKRKQLTVLTNPAFDALNNDGWHFTSLKPFTVHKARERKIRYGRVRSNGTKRKLEF
jgi:hypothetical protein